MPVFVNVATNAAERKNSLIIRDTACAGLAIRVQGAAAGWYLIDRKRNLKIAPLKAYGVDAIDHLRELVSRARAIDADGGDPATILKEALRSASVEEAEAKAGVKAGEWTWENLRDTYLDDVKANKAADTYRGYRSALGAATNSKLAPDFEQVLGKPISLIRPHDIRLVRNSILDRGKNQDGRQVGNVRQANLTLAAFKSCFSWACENYGLTGLTEDPAHQIKPTQKPRKRVEDIKAEELELARRPLTQLELGKLIQFFETYYNPQVRVLCMFQLTTGQRIETVVSIPNFQIIDALDDDPFEKVWRLGPDKSEKYRFLPLPDFAASAANVALRSARPDNRWLFPQQRRRLKGDQLDGHMSKRNASSLFEAARSEGAKLSGLPWVNTHDVRRTFISYLQTNWRTFGFETRLSTDLVTHANEGAGTVSQTIYNKDPNFAEKWKVLSAWDEYLAYGYQYACEGYSEQQTREAWKEYLVERNDTP
ncbi:MAG: tyrosine-type recombinase/integrase [Roseibium sp.]|uniref:tyrosine-type recombinase/integrase n=1 Tax=Roseibium sp. TaxID=1936156 RepID=UPI003D9C04A3